MPRGTDAKGCGDDPLAVPGGEKIGVGHVLRVQAQGAPARPGSLAMDKAEPAEQRRRHCAASVFFLAAAMGFLAVAALALRPVSQGVWAAEPADGLAALKASFARPTFIPHPADNPPTGAKIALGK